MFKLLMSVVRRFPMISGVLALIAPCILIIIDNKVSEKRAKQILKASSLCLCLTCILAFTLIGRRTTTRNYNFELFWKYQLIRDPQFRWEILGNIFLFIPFGFSLSLVLGSGLVQTALIGIGTSIIIELFQYYFCLGMCELDDIFNNTMGTIIGCVYFILLDSIMTHYGANIEEIINRICMLFRHLFRRLTSYHINKKDK